MQIIILTHAIEYMCTVLIGNIAFNIDMNTIGIFVRVRVVAD